MTELKLTLNTARQTGATDALQAAAERKTKATETLEDAWIRVSQSKFTDKERKEFDAAYRAFKAGEVSRIKDGKLTKGEALQIGRAIIGESKERLRESRIRETIENKPDNYHILTDDSELPSFVKRVREEVALQRKEWTDRFDILGVKSMTAGDFEGTGIDSYIDLTIGFSIWLPLLNEGYYLAYGHVDGFDVPSAFQKGDPQLTRSKAIAAIKPYLTAHTEGKTFHMGAPRYDMHVAENDGYSLRGVVWDTLDAMNLMNEHEEAYGLKPLTQKYGKHYGIEDDVYSFDDLFGNRSPAPFNTLLVGIYAINDVKYGWKLFEWQFEIMAKTDRLLECYATVDKDLPETDVFLERSGFRLDFDLLRDLEREYSVKVKEAERRVFETYKIDADFIRKMDRTINANKIAKWQSVQQSRIDKKNEQIASKRITIAELEATKKTHTKKYTGEVEALAKYERELSELAAPIADNAPQEITEFSITNGNHIGYLIYDHLGIADKTYLVDRAKKRSTAADVLDYYYKDEPTLEPLATVAEYTKLLTTYIRPMLGIDREGSVIEVDGRLHSNFKAGGTSTGRYSSSAYSGRSKEVATWL
jgi:DNA polymerase-1